MPKIKNAPDTLPADLDTQTFEAAASELVDEARASTETLTHADLAELMKLNQLVGITSYARAMDSMNKIALLRALQQLKDTKSYKNMMLPSPDGTVIKIKTWQQLCDTLGLSRGKVDEDLLNLAAFGDDMLKAQDSLGIGYRELRGLRGGLASLPEGEREEVQALIASAAASGDREEILATLDEVGARNSKLTRELASAEARARSQEELLSTKNRQLDSLRTRIDTLTNPATPEDRDRLQWERQSNIRQQISTICNSMTGSTVELCRILRDARAHDQAHPDMPPVMTDELWRELDARVCAAWRTMADILTEAGLDSMTQPIDVAAFDPELDADAFDTEPMDARQ